MKDVHDENDRMINETKEILELIKGKHRDMVSMLENKIETLKSQVSSLENDMKFQVKNG